MCYLCTTGIIYDALYMTITRTLWFLVKFFCCTMHFIYFFAVTHVDAWYMALWSFIQLMVSDDFNSLLYTIQQKSIYELSFLVLSIYRKIQRCMGFENTVPLLLVCTAQHTLKIKYVCLLHKCAQIAYIKQIKSVASLYIRNS